MDNDEVLRMADKLSKACDKVFPGHCNDTLPFAQALDENGRCLTFPLIEERAKLDLEIRAMECRMVLHYREDPLEEWQVQEQVIPTSDLPSDNPTGWDHHHQRAEALANMAKTWALPTLLPMWTQLRMKVTEFAKIAGNAANFADFFGDRVEFDFIRSCGSSRHFFIHNNGSTNSRRWLADRPPKDNQLCWALDLRNKKVSVSLVRLQLESSPLSRREYRVVLLADHPRFVHEYAENVLIPEFPIGAYKGDGALIPRSPISDRLAHAVATLQDLVLDRRTHYGIAKKLLTDVVQATMTSAHDHLAEVTDRLDKVVDNLENSGDGNLKSIADMIR